MRTTIHIDDRIFDDLMMLTGATSKTEAVRIALTDYVRIRRKQELLALRGRFAIDDTWRELRDLEYEPYPLPEPEALEVAEPPAEPYGE